MTEYRVYRLNPAKRIVAGEWIEAENDDAALQTAHAMCDAGTPWVEVWQRHRKVAIVPCEPEPKASHA